MKDNKSLVVYKNNIFNKIKNFFKNLLKKRPQNIIEETKQENLITDKQKFNEFISFKEDKEDLKIINEIRNNPNTLNNISLSELDKIEKAIINRQNFINKKISKLKTDLIEINKNLWYSIENYKKGRNKKWEEK